MGPLSSTANTWTYRIRAAVLDSYNPSTHSLTTSWTGQSRLASHFSTHSRQGKRIKGRMHPSSEINTEIIKPHQKVYTGLLDSPIPTSNPAAWHLVPSAFFPVRDVHPFLLEEPSCTVSSLSPWTQLLLSRPSLLAASLILFFSAWKPCSRCSTDQVALLRVQIMGTLEQGRLPQFPRKSEENGAFEEMKRRCNPMASQQQSPTEQSFKNHVIKCQKDTYW